MNLLENEKSRQLIDFLRGCVGSSVPLPQIAVVGDTSSGKSSILSALSNFEFPSSDTLCTRCPIQLRLSRSQSEFKGMISLQYPPEEERKAEQPNHKHEEFDSPRKSAEIIERWMGFAVPDKSGFSNTMVVITAEGPELPSLTLIDLPGIVRTINESNSQREQSVIAQVRSMLQKFVTQSRTVILAVVSAGVAIENQEVLKMAKDADPNGERTLAILSKPDSVERGANKTAIDLMNNRAYPIKLGWASIKCRDKMDRDKGKTIETGIQEERTFFQTTEPWSSMFHSDQLILGCASLQKRLSALLYDRIAAELPGVCSDIDKMLASHIKELESMPTLLETDEERRMVFDSRTRHISELVCKSATSYGLDSFFTDESGSENFWRANVAAQMLIFRDKIHQVCQRIISIRDFDVGKLVVGNLITRVVNGAYQPDKFSDSDKLQCASQQANSHILHPFVAVIKQSIQSSRGPELPGFLSFPVFTRLLDEHVLHSVLEPTKILFDSISAQGLTTAKRAVVDALSGDHDRLKFFLVERVEDVWEKLSDQTRKQLHHALQVERSPSTQNQHFFEKVQHLRAQPVLEKIKSMPGFAVAGAAVPAGSKPQDLPYINRSDVISFINKISGKSNETQETDEMLIALCSYTEVATNRYIDAVEQQIIGFVQSFGNELRKGMKATDRQLESMLAPIESLAGRRKQLEVRVESLRKASRMISQFRCGFSF